MLFEIHKARWRPRSHGSRRDNESLSRHGQALPLGMDCTGGSHPNLREVWLRHMVRPRANTWTNNQKTQSKHILWLDFLPINTLGIQTDRRQKGMMIAFWPWGSYPTNHSKIARSRAWQLHNNLTCLLGNNAPVQGGVPILSRYWSTWGTRTILLAPLLLNKCWMCWSDVRYAHTKHQSLCLRLRM